MANKQLSLMRSKGFGLMAMVGQDLGINYVILIKTHIPLKRTSDNQEK